MKHKMLMLLSFFVFLAMFCGAAAAEEPVLIAHPDVTIDTLQQKEAARIFLGKTTRWENGDKIIPVVLKKGALHDAFLKKVVKKTPFQFSNYWKRLVFTGRARAIKNFKQSEELVTFVSQTKGAIGYAQQTAATDSVKIISLTE